MSLFSSTDWHIKDLVLQPPSELHACSQLLTVLGGQQLAHPSTSGIKLQSTQGTSQNKMSFCTEAKAVSNSAFLDIVCNHPCTLRSGARNSFLNRKHWVPRITLPWNSKVPRHYPFHPQEITPLFLKQEVGKERKVTSYLAESFTSNNTFLLLFFFNIYIGLTTQL